MEFVARLHYRYSAQVQRYQTCQQKVFTSALDKDEYIKSLFKGLHFRFVFMPGGVTVPIALELENNDSMIILAWYSIAQVNT